MARSPPPGFPTCCWISSIWATLLAMARAREPISRSSEAEKLWMRAVPPMSREVKTSPKESRAILVCIFSGRTALLPLRTSCFSLRSSSARILLRLIRDFSPVLK